MVAGYPGGRSALCACLDELGCEAVAAPATITRRAVAWRELVDAVIVIHAPPFHDGARLVAEVRRRAPGLPAIVVADPRTFCAAELSDAITLVRPHSFAAIADAVERFEGGPRLAC